eukprot:TRINITY_DN1479_c0_g5_i1.p1 TRINITY_DN1479_c0_g5~~TRINITY_DN1479_c0_g5_i1.p1  ORF type:complete len:467 (-),score=84.65 TRINITY_DN1479_c0_g5_i1:331-1617(-)
MSHSDDFVEVEKELTSLGPPPLLPPQGAEDDEGFYDPGTSGAAAVPLSAVPSPPVPANAPRSAAPGSFGPSAGSSGAYGAFQPGTPVGAAGAGAPAGASPSAPGNFGIPGLGFVQNAASGGTARFWTVAFYQPYFDLDVADVVARVRASFTLSPPDYLSTAAFYHASVGTGTALEDDNQPLDVEGVESNGNGASAGAEGPLSLAYWGLADCGSRGRRTAVGVPDMYGPVWLAATLWVVVAVSSHLSSSIAAAFVTTASTGTSSSVAVAQPALGSSTVGGSPIPDSERWKGNGNGGVVGGQGPFVIAVSALSTVCAYYLGAVALWAVLKWRGHGGVPGSGLLEAVSLTGYSLAAYIPAALLCWVPVTTVRFVLLMAAAALAAATPVMCLRRGMIANLAVADPAASKGLSAFAAAGNIIFALALFFGFYW